MNPTWSPATLAVARQLAVHAPVRLLHVLEYHVDLVGGGLADLHHRVGDGGDDLALLLVGAAGVPLNRDVGHGRLPPAVGRRGYRRRRGSSSRRRSSGKLEVKE